jgi:hypothetical protein
LEVRKNGIESFCGYDGAIRGKTVNKKLANQIVDLLERLDAESFILRSALRNPHGKRTKEEVDAMVLLAISDPDLRERYREAWQPLRATLLVEDDFDKALKEFRPEQQEPSGWN